MDKDLIQEIKWPENSGSENINTQEMCQSFLRGKTQKPAHSKMGFLTFSSCKSETVLYNQ